ncbi:MAG: carbamoyltransferase N-terminal domain-containing protein, partial [Actinomycetes bacterium]
PSPFDRAAILTMDGVGEWATTSYGTGSGNTLALLAELRFPHSPGLLYSAFTYFTGFKVNSAEYKVMGLAPYGEPKYVDAIYRHLIDLKADGSFKMDMEFFDYCAGLTMTSRKFDGLFGGPPRQPESPLTQREMDLARSLQDVTELRRKEKQLNAQSALIREIHHRVKNNLQNVVALLRLQMHRSKSRTVKTEFSACINRVLSFAQVHDVFAQQNWDSIDLLELTDYLLTKLVDNYRLPGQSIQTSVRGQPVRVSASQAVPMALVINELVTNMLKHAFPPGFHGQPTACVALQSDRDTCRLTVADNGVGLPPGFDWQASRSLGLRLVNLWVTHQLGGALNVRGDGGTAYTITFRRDGRQGE